MHILFFKKVDAPIYMLYARYISCTMNQKKVNFAYNSDRREYQSMVFAHVHLFLLKTTILLLIMYHTVYYKI